MLVDELKKIDVSEDVKFEGVGVVLVCPVNGLFYKIAFGGGDNSDDLCEGCDDYMYLQIDKYTDEGDFIEDYDGGQLDIRRKEYTGFINDEKLIRDCLQFLDCPDVDSCIFIRKFFH